jgi:citrate/tricarballylate utilization protein
MQNKELITQGQEMMRICNSCRYCEGLCAVWRSMEYRRQFPEGDLNYLANLCHDCSECYYACQYAPPHEWDINPPKTFAKLRAYSYEKYAWPGWLASAYRANGLVVALAAAFVMVCFFFGITLAQGEAGLWSAVPGGDFYQIASHNFMVSTFGIVALFSLAALGYGVIRYLKDLDEKISDLLSPANLKAALKETLTLEYLDGGGWGCAYPQNKRSPIRRWLHHATFFGFLLCFAATTVGFIYDFLFGWSAPYSYFSLPVLLGFFGGLGLLAGPVGLLYFKFQRDQDVTDANHNSMDSAFLVLLALASLTGLLLLILRETSAIGFFLAAHLGVVMALFLTAPYSKFVHGIYRFLAIAKYARERKLKRHIGG